MTTYAKATNVRVPYLTEGREYEVLDETVVRSHFFAVDDEGHRVMIPWHGGPATFQRIEKEEA